MKSASPIFITNKVVSVKDFIKHFEREPNGAWLCVSHAEYSTIMGRIQVAEGTRFMPGTIFMTVDVVQLLEEESERQYRPS